MAENNLPTISMEEKLHDSRVRIINARADLYTQWLAFGQAWLEFEQAICEANGLVMAANDRAFVDQKVKLPEWNRRELIGSLVDQLPQLRNAIQGMMIAALFTCDAVRHATAVDR